MDTDEKIARFAGLKAQFPESEMPRWSLATAFEEAERYDEAVAEFRELVDLKPDYCVAYLHLGSSLLELERYDEALEALEGALELAIDQGHNAPKLEAEMLIERAHDEM